jgi:hypothetical protein
LYDCLGAGVVDEQAVFVGAVAFDQKVAADADRFFWREAADLGLLTARGARDEIVRSIAKI